MKKWKTRKHQRHKDGKQQRHRLKMWALFHQYTDASAEPAFFTRLPNWMHPQVIFITDPFVLLENNHQQNTFCFFLPVLVFINL